MTTSLKYPAFISKRWLSSYRASLIYYPRYLAYNVLFLGLARPKRQPGRKLKNKTLNYEIFTSINYPSFVRTTLFSLINLDAINGWAIGGLVSYHSA